MSALGQRTGDWRVLSLASEGDVPWGFRPVRVMHAAVVLLTVSQIGRIPLLSTGDREAPLLVNDLCVLAMLFVATLRAVVTRRFVVDSVGGMALLFGAVGGFAALLAIPRFGLTGGELVVSLAYLARWMVYFGVYLAVVNLTRAEDGLALWRTLERTILAFAAFGIVQAIFLPHFAQLVYPESRLYIDWDEQGHRLVSTVLDPNIAGAMIMLVLLVQIAQLAGGERIAMWRPTLLFGALLATLSRSSMLGLTVGGLLILAVRGVSRRMMQFAGITAVAFLAALPKIVVFAQQYGKLKVDDSALTRVAHWLMALRIFSDYPVLGVGFNTYGYVQERYGAVRLGGATYSSDGGLLFIAVMTGVVGLALYLGMLAIVVIRCRAIWRDPAAPAEWRSLATGIAAATIAVCVHSVFVNSLLTTFVMEMLWIMWGLSFVCARTLRDGRAASR